MAERHLAVSFKNAIVDLVKEATSAQVRSLEAQREREEREARSKSIELERQNKIDAFKERLHKHFQHMIGVLKHQNMDPEPCAPDCEIHDGQFLYKPVVGVSYIHPHYIQTQEQKESFVGIKPEKRYVWIFWAVTVDGGMFGYSKNVNSLLEHDKKSPTRQHPKDVLDAKKLGITMVGERSKLDELAALSDEEVEAQLTETLYASWAPKQTQSPKAG